MMHWYQKQTPIVRLPVQQPLTSAAVPLGAGAEAGVVAPRPMAAGEVNGVGVDPEDEGAWDVGIKESREVLASPYNPVRSSRSFIPKQH